MRVIKETQYLVFEDMEVKKRKTKLLAIRNKNSDDIIGYIECYPSWRQYCFFPEFDTVWNITCLNDVQEVTQKLMKDRKTDGKDKN